MARREVKPLHLAELETDYAICRLPPTAAVPTLPAGGLVSITRTDEELSVVCPTGAVPTGLRTQPGWRCFKVAGPLDFSQIGILAALAGPLADAGVGIFVISTFDTDYLLVQAAEHARTVATLAAAGHTVTTVARERTPR